MTQRPTANSYRVTIDGVPRTVTFVERADDLYAACDGHEVLVEAHTPTAAPRQRVSIDERTLEFGVRRTKDGVEVVLDGAVYHAEIHDERALQYRTVVKQDNARKASIVKAPMPGLVVTVLVKPGDSVKRDQSLLTLNAMKLENDIRSPQDGTVKEVLVKPEQAVEKGAKLVVLE